MAGVSSLSCSSSPARQTCSRRRRRRLFHASSTTTTTTSRPSLWWKVTTRRPLALREYARRRARHRASLSGLQEDNNEEEDEQMGQLMRAVSALQKHGLDTADSNLLRDRVERTYAKPWQVNARIDDTVSVPPPPPPQTEEETTRLKATKNYEKPWRHMAKPPQPPAEFEVTGTGLGPPVAVGPSSAPGGPPSPDVVRSTSRERRAQVALQLAGWRRRWTSRSCRGRRSATCRRRASGTPFARSETIAAGARRNARTIVRPSDPRHAPTGIPRPHTLLARTS